mgnify:CR=1 FL=1
MQFSLKMEVKIFSFLAFEYFELNGANLPTLLNSVQWLHDNATPNWLTFSPESAEDVPFPDGLVNLELTIDTEGLLGGTYYLDLIIQNKKL